MRYIFDWLDYNLTKEDKMKNITVYERVIIPLLVFLAFPGSIIAVEGAPSAYVLIFQGSEYDSKLGSAVDYFFNEVLKPQDSLLIITPQKPYNYSPQTRQSQSPAQMIQITKDVLKRDISMGAASYKSILEQMEIIVDSLASGGAEGRSLLVQYRQLLENLRNIRKWNDDIFIKLAQMLQQNKGENHIFIFYQTELRIIPDRNALNKLRNDPELKFDVSEAFEAENFGDVIGVEKVSQALKGCRAKLHFIYLKIKQRRRQGMEEKEFSGDIFNAFSKIAGETGGQVETSSRALPALKKIVGEMKK
jgi:hypothetical protein